MKLQSLQCPSCGASVSTRFYPMVCDYCESEIVSDDNFPFIENRVVQNLRSLHGAQVTFQATMGCGDFGTPAALFDCGLIERALFRACCGFGETPKHSLNNYTFQFSIERKTPQLQPKFQIIATPDYDKRKIRRWNFFIDEMGVIRFTNNDKLPNADAPIFDESIFEPSRNRGFQTR
ncbi:MAG: hypothetical protein H7Z37_03880 [Pyrinomonadaceae bacterium]|nr:hypothetical protein [Pyrinomonadaceae bacterium]